MRRLICVMAIAAVLAGQPARAAEPTRAVDARRLPAVVLQADKLVDTGTPCVRIPDVIYGRKFGMALTMDVLKPPRPNGAAVIWAVSGGFKSSYSHIAGDGFVRYMGPFLKRGYTVFAVVHGSMPKFEMREITADFHRAVRFIRHNARTFGIDPARFGISGGSAGGYLALWMGTTGAPGKAKARDPIDRQSSAVQAVACFYPGTDWVNFHGRGANVLDQCRRMGLIEGFNFRDFHPVRKEYVRVTDLKKVEAILADYSPINHVTPKAAPTLIIHGDKDAVVPLTQAERMVQKLKAAGVPAQLVVKKGGGHGWRNMTADMEQLADWYDKHLKPVRKQAGGGGRTK